MADFGILAKIGVDASQMSKGLDKAQGKMDSFGKRIGTAVKAGVLVAGAAIAAMAVKGISDFMDFEKKMAEVFTLMPGMTREAEGKMTADMRNLAKTMGVDLIDATNALYQAISAGVDPDNAVTFLETASKAAIAGVADLETSVGALTVIMNGYAMEASQAEEISDVLFSTVAIGVTTFDKLGKNIGKVVPLAASLGITIQEVGAMFAVLTKTMSTAEAGTQIRAMLAELSKEGQKAFEFFKEASGKTFPDFIKQGGSVTDALRILGEHSKTTGKGMIDMFGGIEAGMGALTLAADNADVLAEALKEIQGGSGSMIVAFERMKKTSAHQMNVMKRNFEDLGITMGAALLPFVNAVLPALTRAFEMLAEGVLAVTGFISEHPEIFKELGKMLKVVAAGIIAYNAGLLLMAIRSAAAAVGTNLMAIATAVMSGSMAKLNATMRMNPFLLIVGLVAMVVTAFKLWGASAEEAGEMSAAASKKALGKYQQLIDAAKKARKEAIQSTLDIRKEMERRTQRKALVAEGASGLEVDLKLAKENLEVTEKQLRIQGQREKGRQVEAGFARQQYEWALKNFEAGKINAKEMIAFELDRENAATRTALSGDRREQLLQDQQNILEQIADLEDKITKEVEGRLDGMKEAKRIIEETRREHELSQTGMGKALLIAEKIDLIVKERRKILEDIRKGIRGEVDSAKELATLTKEKLGLEKEFEQLLVKERNQLLNEEIKIHQDAVKELGKKLGLQEKIRDAAKGAAEQAERELGAQRKIAQEGAKELKGLEEQFAGKKFHFVTGKRIGIGEFKLSSFKLRQQFRELQAKGQLPEGVKNLRDFQKQVEDQIRQAQQKARGAGGKANALQAQAIAERAKEKAAADAIAAINVKINNAKLATIEAENKLLDKSNKTLAEITTALLKMDAALAQVRQVMPGAIPVKDDVAVGVDRAMAAAFRQAQQAVKAIETFTTTTGLTYEGSETDMDETVEELETANVTLGDIRHSLEGFFVNQ